ncbi:hypothetical protein J2T16_002752 [Paenibacillus intestini]|nr:hypothetical protein [Paenibacillus intestini]
MNPSILRVSEKNITYAPAFKFAAVQAYEAEHIPMGIFVQAGFNIELIGLETRKRCLERWRKTCASSGEAGLLEERRGKGRSGRPVSRELSSQEKLHLAEARIKLLEAENELLKKLEAP